MPFTICYLLTLMLSLASYVQPHHKKCVSSTYDKNHNLRDTASPRVTQFFVLEKMVYLENKVSWSWYKPKKSSKILIKSSKVFKIRKFVVKIIMNTVFPHILSAETILFWLLPYVLWPLITVHKCAETIWGNTVHSNWNEKQNWIIFRWEVLIFWSNGL